MIPVPNVVAGVLIGLVNTGWVEIIGSALIWSVIYCFYVSITEQPRVEVTLSQYRKSARKLFFRSPAATFYSIEFVTALFTALPVACLTFLVKKVFI